MPDLPLVVTRSASLNGLSDGVFVAEFADIRRSRMTGLLGGAIERFVGILLISKSRKQLQHLHLI